MLAGRRTRQRAILAAIATVGIALGAVTFVSHGLDSTLQAATYDTFITKSPAVLSNQVTIVALDDATVARYGSYPLPRQAWVQLLAALKPLTPRSVALDVAFYDDSQDLEQDRALASAIKDLGNVILPMQGTGVQTKADGVVRYSSEQLPTPLLRQAAAGLGSVNVDPDEDGRVRRAQLVIETPTGRYYALPLVATVRSLLSAKVVAENEQSMLQTGDALVLRGRAGLVDRVMPIDESGGMAIYYAAPPASDLSARGPNAGPCADPAEFCVVSFADIVAGRVPRDLIANRTLLVGAHSLSAVPDTYPTPNSGSAKMWGVEMWANTAASIFTNRFPQPRESIAITLVEILVVTLGGILLVARFRLYGFFGAILGLSAYALVRFVLFVAATRGQSSEGPIAVASLGYLVPASFWWVVALGYLLVEEQRAVFRTQTIFGRFVTPSIARTIMDIEESGKLALGGEEKCVTVLFGDIRGFTTLSEGMTPGVLLDTLNRYFEGIVNIVNRYEGTVNKYNGDNIMVIWGAPLPVADHARKAVQAALEIERWIVAERSTGGPDVSFGFGINTGPVIAGFLGAMGRMEYTVVGDTANVASRLTSSDIARRDQVAVSAETLAELGSDVIAIDLGDVHVKGRVEAIRCYQVNSIGVLESPNPAPAPERPIGAAAVAGYH
ncbi:MAG: adenylate/guanylate cyclase domain-containing protein [Chloroflexota bacterium]|nr:adenylate/guanylate cyclase domain-containing protein [Chloroflexota bacterium]